jgi:hypothetical protein
MRVQHAYTIIQARLHGSTAGAPAPPAGAQDTADESDISKTETSRLRTRMKPAPEAPTLDAYTLPRSVTSVLLRNKAGRLHGGSRKVKAAAAAAAAAILSGAQSHGSGHTAHEHAHAHAQSHTHAGHKRNVTHEDDSEYNNTIHLYCTYTYIYVIYSIVCAGATGNPMTEETDTSVPRQRRSKRARNATEESDDGTRDAASSLQSLGKGINVAIPQEHMYPSALLPLASNTPMGTMYPWPNAFSLQSARPGEGHATVFQFPAASPHYLIPAHAHAHAHAHTHMPPEYVHMADMSRRKAAPPPPISIPSSAARVEGSGAPGDGMSMPMPMPLHTFLHEGQQHASGPSRPSSKGTHGNMPLPSTSSVPGTSRHIYVDGMSLPYESMQSYEGMQHRTPRNTHLALQPPSPMGMSPSGKGGMTLYPMAMPTPNMYVYGPTSMNPNGMVVTLPHPSLNSSSAMSPTAFPLASGHPPPMSNRSQGDATRPQSSRTRVVMNSSAHRGLDTSPDAPDSLGHGRKHRDKQPRMFVFDG